MTAVKSAVFSGRWVERSFGKHGSVYKGTRKSDDVAHSLMGQPGDDHPNFPQLQRKKSACSLERCSEIYSFRGQHSRDAYVDIDEVQAILEYMNPGRC